MLYRIAVRFPRPPLNDMVDVVGQDIFYVTTKDLARLMNEAVIRGWEVKMLPYAPSTAEAVIAEVEKASKIPL